MMAKLTPCPKPTLRILYDIYTLILRIFTTWTSCCHVGFGSSTNKNLKSYNFLHAEVKSDILCCVGDPLSIVDMNSHIYIIAYGHISHPSNLTT